MDQTLFSYIGKMDSLSLSHQFSADSFMVQQKLLLIKHCKTVILQLKKKEINEKHFSWDTRIGMFSIFHL